MSAQKSKAYVPQGILFLQGVFKRDIGKTEESYQEQLSHLDMKVYDKIPVNFTTPERWLKSTNICCWYCSRTFKGRPWFEPQSIEPVCDVSSGGMLSKKELINSINKKSVSIVINGIFCSCNCVRAYIDLHTRDISERHNKIEMLKYIYEIFTGKKIPDIQPSPPPTEMIQYGGYITSQDYQQKIEQLDGSYQKELDDNNFASICNMFKKQQSAGIY